MQRSLASDHYIAFLEGHSLRDASAIEAERNIIHRSREVVSAVNRGYAQLSEIELTQSPAIGLLLNMFHRAFEHLDAAIVGFTTGSAASSEGLSRAAVELAVSIRYILAGQPEARMIAFLAHYLSIEEKRIRNWREEVKWLSAPDRDVHIQEIERRRAGVVAMEGLVAQLREEFFALGFSKHAEVHSPGHAPISS